MSASSAIACFSSASRRVTLRSEAFSWLGTPFRERQAIKGPLGGVDCANFVAQVFLACGAISQEIAVPPYDVEHAQHSDESLLVSWFERPEVRQRLRFLDEEEFALDGDIVFVRTGRALHHMGLQIGPEIVHCVRPAGVVRMPLAVPGFAARIASRFRLYEP